MRLAAKLILLYLFGLGLIVAVFTWLTIQNQRRAVAVAHGQQASHLVAAIRPLIERALAEGDEEVVREHLRLASRQLATATLRYISPGGTMVVRRRQTIIRPSDDGLHMISAVPIQYQNRSAGTIEIDSIDAIMAENLRQSAMTAALSLTSVTVLSSAVIFLGALYLVGRPLRELIGRVDRIADGDFGESPPASCERRLGGRDELGQLGRAIDAMRIRLFESRQRIETETATRIAAQQQLWHADRLGTVGRLAAGVAHEVGTPLAVVSGRAELIADGTLPQNDVRQSAIVIKEQSDRIGSIVRQLLGFARPGGRPGSREVITVESLVRQSIQLVETILDQRQVAVQTSGDAKVTVRVDASQMQQVFINLFSNAVDAGADQIVVDCHPVADQVMIDVHDNGDGIDPETAEHLFEPFYTTKDVGSGTGLGLSIAYGIIEEHGGRIHVQNRSKSNSSTRSLTPSAAKRLGDGTTLTLELPRENDEAIDSDC